MEMTD